ncbi:unnamed protein product [Rotaria magnacalcarata]|uniref:G-protein coupled receptors family 1 profile domain-containing protein n=1 Tax=Rotaria magnacalcarata TaxID=392030 RepID=A0A816UM10_9BILA|nr:unnamed protein product [Rotaria magnacalcarata]CAF3980440.1 unnamed protein product [Rotaria magnacalcarata]
MSDDSEPHRPSFRFRDKLSRFKERVKEKVRDKANKHNIATYIHENFTSTDTNHHVSRHGFRQHMHEIKDAFKNKTHYEAIKEKVKHKIDDKIDLHDNKTYPKGFYDSLFSPETENEVYLQTALVCLWAVAILCIIPTIIVIFLPSKNQKARKSSTNMIFFHVFLCEVFYLIYILLAMINVAQDFRLGPSLCDVANYGMYVTIPIMQFALLFLSLERLQSHFNLSMTWAKIFTKPYLIQVILCVTWLVLLALLTTFMFIKKQFTFNFFKDQAMNLAPPIVGDVLGRLASRRHHCSVDGRLSSVFKTLIIVLFIILIVKPIIISIGFNLLTPFCCKAKRKDQQKQGDRRTTTLVTIFLLLNLFFSFPFYFVSMFNSILTRIDSTKDTFSLILKICFILRITNIIFECLAFYIFERNSWSLISKLFYYGTCKKFPIFKTIPDDDMVFTKDPAVLDLIKKTREPSDQDEEEDDDDRKTKNKKKHVKGKAVKKTEPTTESEPDDGAFKKVNKKHAKPERAKTPEPSEEDDDKEEHIIQHKPDRTRKFAHSDEDEEDLPKGKTSKKPTSSTKKVQSDDDDEDEPQYISTTKRTSRSKKIPSDNDDDDDDDQERQIINPPKRKSRTRHEEEVAIIQKPKPNSTKTNHGDEEKLVSNGKSTSHRPPSTTHTTSNQKPAKTHSRQPSPAAAEEEEEEESEVDGATDASQTSSKKNRTSVSPKRRRKVKTKIRSSSKEHKRTHSSSQPTAKTTKPTSAPHGTRKHSHHTTTTTQKPKAHTKHSKIDRYSEILERSQEV